MANPNVYFMGCPCHLVHNAACAASDSLSKSTGFDVEEMSVYLFYWFDKSSKRKSILKDYCIFCDVTYRKVMKHVSTRWLSLEIAFERASSII